MFAGQFLGGQKMEINLSIAVEFVPVNQMEK
jgi:hypothetical protein